MDENKKDDITKEVSVVNKNQSIEHIKNNVDSFNKLNLFDNKDLVAAENLINRLMKTDKGGGIKSVNDGIAMIMRAQSLNLPFAASLEHIHVIQGKTGIDIHIIKALLIRGGCTWEHTKNYEPVYEFTDGFNVYLDNVLPKYCVRCATKSEAIELSKKEENKDKFVVYPVSYYKDFNGNTYKSYQLNSNFEVAITKEHALNIKKENKIPIYRIPNLPVDYIDEWTFERKIGNRTMTSVGKFSYQEAVAAGMFDKDTYKKYTRILIGHRSFTYGARDIGSDLLLGCMETTELKQTMGIPLSDEDFVDAEIIK